jgi:hypothetical protein
MMMTETSQCSNKPMNGALRGLLLAHSLENGSMPSLPISWTTVGCQHRISDGNKYKLTSTLRKDYAQNVAKGRQCHKHGQHSFSFRAENVSKELGCKNASRAYNIGLRDSGEVSNLDSS